MDWTREARYKPLKEVSEEEWMRLHTVVRSCPWRQSYHIQPPVGLLNDPNGFSYYNGVYHLFYQWFPLGPVHGLKHWYHVTSTDLVHWQEKGIAISPDRYFDSHGAFSGTGIVIGEELHLYYTGNVRDENWERTPYQCLAKMDQLGEITKVETPLVTGVPEGYTEHYRDPKVFSKNGAYFMLVGAQRTDETGALTVYESKDTQTWAFRGELKTDFSGFGFMWECPDYYERDGKGVLIFSPQGLEEKGNHYQNIFQSGYVVGKPLEIESLEMEHGAFYEFDQGFDFYAPQTTEDQDGRRILVGWMGLPEIAYPTDRHEWAHCLTIPRELTILGDRILQRPVREMEKLRTNRSDKRDELNRAVKVYEGFEGTTYELQASFTTLDWRDFGVRFRCGEEEYTEIRVDPKWKRITVDRSKSGEAFAEEFGTTRSASLSFDRLITLRLYVDQSSFELFVQGGEEVFSGRIFPSEGSTEIEFFSDGAVSLRATKWDIGK